MTPPQTSLKALLSWAMYDWGSSGFAVVIQTFVFAAYFTGHVAPNETIGTHLWGNAMGIAGLLVALGGPVIGAIADCGGQRKKWLAFFIICFAVPTGLMWFIEPSQSFIWPALMLVAFGTIAEEYAFIFYNSMLPMLAPVNQIGRWSGWGWSMGYFGGTACLVCALALYTLHGYGWLPLNDQLAEPTRIIFPLTALWIIVFSLPLFLFVPEQRKAKVSIHTAVTRGIQQLWGTVKQLKRYAVIARFLVARTIFIDGMATLFAFGGVYAAGTFHMSQPAILLFGITLNIAAGLGAAGFAFLDDWLGGKRTLMIALICLSLSCIGVLLVESQASFWFFGFFVGFFIGPAQAISRSLLARMAPPELQIQMFGFFAVSGKATAFMGPLLVGWVTLWTSSQRLGMSSILLFFLVGIAVLSGVKEPQELRS